MGATIWEDRYGVVAATLTPVSTAAGTTAEQTFTVQGLLPTDFVSVNLPAATAYLGLVGARVSAANTLALTFSNQSSAGLTSASGVHRIYVHRAEKQMTSFQV